jgi:3alpha(or 20beta)-hydroxysteroid dehydrogenase
MGRLDGKIAIITGASQGMGEAFARRFVHEGARVVLTDVNEAAGVALADALGDAAVFVRHDVRNVDDWRAVVDRATRDFGAVTVLVNNAGVLGEIASAIELSQADYQTVCDVNQLGVFLGIQTVVPSMIEAGGGSIINISSISGIVAIYGSPSIAYVASKFAVRGMTKQVAVEFGPQKIRCNSICPGYIKTSMMVAATDEEGGEATTMMPLARLGTSDEVAGLALFLASDESAFITGADHVVDGGLTAV